MDLIKVLAELREERARVEGAIRALQTVGMNGQKRRGRPPKWMTEARENVPKERGRPGKVSH